MKIFDGINEKAKTDIISRCDEVQFNKGENLYKKGSIGFLLSGTAKVIRTGSIGGSVTVRNITDGDIFGAASLFGDWDKDFSKITAESKCSVCFLNENEFVKVLKEYPDFAINYIIFLTDRIRFLNRRLDTFSAGSTKNKLYEFMLSQANSNGEVELKISLCELSKRLNIGRTSLYRDISSLENANLIKRNGKKIILK